MVLDRCMVTTGVTLLAVSALTGFVQHHYRSHPERVALWRVTHHGGTAGAVQLIALGEIWNRAGDGLGRSAVGVGVMFATLAFFFGPLARALGYRRVADTIVALGGLVALPAYATLPIVGWLCGR
jgi:hypothetical protein